MPRTVPSPIIAATFTDGCKASIAANHAANDPLSRPADAAAVAPHGRELPSCPATIVVIPWRTTDSARGSSHTLPSPCE
ncbi:MAG: hypothetical protein IPF98_21520 [Gemmatimonadetes bacterium]|nr:hypothetical protein [Gemmatimonadota bacterium]